MLQLDGNRLDSAGARVHPQGMHELALSNQMTESCTTDERSLGPYFHVNRPRNVWGEL